MNRFDSLFFGQYIGTEEKIEQVFHRHFFVIVEDILLWVFFGVIIPAFLYYYDVFALQEAISTLYVSLYLLIIYAILIYKIFDWYADVWVATTTTLIDVKWRWFTSHLLYIPYEKIEGIEVRTHSWVAAIFRMSDVVVKLMGQEEFILASARDASVLVAFLQEATKNKKAGGHGVEKEPFDILVGALSDVVKWHLVTQGKTYITRDYVEKLDETLTAGKPIDLRTQDEKIIIENWKHEYDGEAKEEETDHNHKA
jgi:hypothetical protein